MSTRVLGTAGHVDHGKTALVRALTGVDTDRLQQEKQRGITIELGFAQLALADGAVSLVDVPGHERFVRHMVAGAGGIDGYLLCVAADDGVMPQTREHMAVLELLGVDEGVVAITKCDLADATMARNQVRALLGDHVSIIDTSVASGQGLDELRRALAELTTHLDRQRAEGPARLFVDRAFTVAGAGTVVTGTLWGAQIDVDQRVRVFPAAVPARVRRVQVHDADVTSAAGGRVALNLAGVHRDRVPRGSVVVAESDQWQPTTHIDVALHWLPTEPSPLTTRRRLQVFHGTAEVPATFVLLEGTVLQPGQRGYVQLRLEAPLVARAGDRVIVRSAERRTVGGGVIVDPAAQRHGLGAQVAERLRALERGQMPEARQETIPPPRPAVSAPRRSIGCEAMVLDVIRRAGRRPPTVAGLAQETGLDTCQVEVALRYLEDEGQLVQTAEVWFAAAILEDAVAQARAALEAGPMTIGQLRDLWGVGRRHALAIAAHLDRQGMTLRRGEHRVLRRSVMAGTPNQADTLPQ